MHSNFPLCLTNYVSHFSVITINFSQQNNSLNVENILKMFCVCLCELQICLRQVEGKNYKKKRRRRRIRKTKGREREEVEV